ncbi:MAG: permease [Desulfovibrio sp.]|nr:permease [Desulfovibrio sp.]
MWGAAYFSIGPLAHWAAFAVPGLDAASHMGQALEFFLYDTAEILLLLIALIYVIAWLRASINTERMRAFLAGKKRCLGYFLGALFGSVTPFCSCSSIPLFLGFTTARIPFGITMAFLIINEIAVVLLWSLLGWKFTILYMVVGMAAGMAGGFFMDAIQAERWLQPFILDARNLPPPLLAARGRSPQMTLRQRHVFAWGEMRSIFRRVWKWVIVGVAVGAALHGFVPDNWFARHLGAGQWWTVPVAVLVAIPLYSNVTGIVPVMESLLLKGLPLGTTLAFCMSAVGASIPEVMLLRQIMTVRLQAAFLACLWVIFTIIGWIFDSLGPFLI